MKQEMSFRPSEGFCTDLPSILAGAKMGGLAACLGSHRFTNPTDRTVWEDVDGVVLRHVTMGVVAVVRARDCKVVTFADLTGPDDAGIDTPAVNLAREARAAAMKFYAASRAAQFIEEKHAAWQPTTHVILPDGVILVRVGERISESTIRLAAGILSIAETLKQQDPTD